MSGRVYGRSANYYDDIYRGLVDYEGDVAFLLRIVRRYVGRSPRSLLDLGCGTGTHALLFARRGVQVTGLDASRTMLALARDKAKAAGLSLRLVHGSMRSFRLPRRFDLVISMFGAIGYLLTARSLLGCLGSVRRHLVPGGLFIFEYWQTSGVKSGHQSWLDRRTREFEILRLSESTLHRRPSRVSMDFRYFVLRGGQLRDRFVEHHVVRTYTRGEMGRLLRRSGLERLGEFAATPGRKAFDPVTPDTFRILAVAGAHS